MKCCRICRAEKDLSCFGPNNQARDGLKSACRPCLSNEQRRWKAAHFVRRRPKLTPEQRSVLTKIWHKKSRDRRTPERLATLRAERRIYRQQRRSLETAKCRDYYARTRDQQRARVAAYFKNNPLKKRESEGRRRARKLATTTAPVDYRVITERDRMVCHICLECVDAADLHFDHVIPLSKGGTHTMENIKVSHALCNLRKSDSLLFPAHAVQRERAEA